MSKHTIPTELNIAPRGKSWLNGQLIDGVHGHPTRQSMESAERAALTATTAAGAPAPALIDDMKQELMDLYNEIMKQGRGMHYWNYAAAVLDRYRNALAATPAAKDFAEAYDGAREDLSIWKRRALEAERDLRAERQSTQRLVAEINATNGPTHLGEAAAPVLLPEPVGAIAWNRDGARPTFHAGCRDKELLRARLDEGLSGGPYRTEFAFTEPQLRALLATATGLPAQAVYAIDPVQAAADAASVGHLSHLVDHQTVLLSRAMAVMKAVELTASPIDESDGDLDARIPYEAWSTFVDARAALLHAVAQSPVAAPQAQADAQDALTPAARDVLAERQRQISAEGWTPEHDDSYTGGELADAAATYAACTPSKPYQLEVMGVPVWPWPIHWWKPTTYRRNLEKSGALILAEIERIDRAAIAAAKGE